MVLTMSETHRSRAGACEVVVEQQEGEEVLLTHGSPLPLARRGHRDRLPRLHRAHLWLP